MTILINDILNLKNLENTKIRFVVPNLTVDPIELFKNDRKELLNWLFWNYGKKEFKVGQTAIGFVKIEKDKWLLFDISKITKELDVFGGVGYEYEQMNEFD